MLNALMDQRRIKPGQGGGAFEHNISSVFAFAHAPVVGQGHGTAQFGGMGVALLQQRLQQNWPLVMHLRVGQLLSASQVFNPSEAVLALNVTNAGLIQLAGQPVTPVKAKMNGKGKPRLEAQVQEAQLLVKEIKVVVETLAGFQAQHQFLLFPVATHKISQTGFHYAPDTDEPAGQTIAASQITGQQLLSLAAAVQIEQGTFGLLSQLMGGTPHPVGPSCGKGAKILEQDPHADEITCHECWLIKCAQCGHQTEAVKPRKNTDDIAGVLSYKGTRGGAGCGGNFDFHTNVLSHGRRPVCPAELSSSVSLRVHPWLG